MSEHDEHIKLQLTEVLANQQSIYDAMADLNSRFDTVETILQSLVDKNESRDTTLLGVDEEQLYIGARELVIETGKASTSLLQRVLRVGYARAAILIELLEENGVIGPMDGTEPRAILMSQEDLDEEDENNVDLENPRA